MAEQQSSVPTKLLMQKVGVAVTQAAPPNRAELVRLIVLLFTAMRTCHEAYLRKNAADGDALGMAWETWRGSVQVLIGMVDKLGTTLHIMAPDVFQDITIYANVEVLEAFGDDSLKYLAEISYAGSSYHEPEFRDVLDSLGEFIRENFSMEEVFQATTSTSS
jgi:hypothetical protein